MFLSIHLSVHPSHCLSTPLTVCPPLSLSVHLSHCLSTPLTVCPPRSLSVHPSHCLSTPLTVYPSLSLSIHLSLSHNLRKEIKVMVYKTVCVTKILLELDLCHIKTLRKDPGEMLPMLLSEGASHPVGKSSH